MSRNNKPGKRKLGIFNILVLAGNAVFILFLILAYMAIVISPAKSWIFPFFGLLYPYLVIVNSGFVIYWVVMRRWYFLLSLIAIALGWQQFQRNIQVRIPGKSLQGESYFKLMSYNVKNLSNDNVDLLEPEVRDNILSFLDQENADILCLQEFAIVHPDPEAFIDSLSIRLNMPYHARSQYIEKPGKRVDAIFVFSKFPIIRYGSLKKDDEHNYALFADILIEKDTVRLYNVHLESIRLKHEDYNFISDLDLQFRENENIKEGSRRIIGKLRTAFRKRAAQADDLAGHLGVSPYSVILCGDFNDTPNSYTYQRLTRRLNDAFIKSGSGFGNTYIGKLPSYRIDYILYSDGFTSHDYRRGTVRYSDHYPVSCLLHAK